jgi:hypothetical protein
MCVGKLGDASDGASAKKTFAHMRKANLEGVIKELEVDRRAELRVGVVAFVFIRNLYGADGCIGVGRNKQDTDWIAHISRKSSLLHA